MQTLPERDAEVTENNSSTLTNSAALCHICKKWYPTRYMFWDNGNICSGCKKRDDFRGD